MEKVCVLMSTYNGEKYIYEQIKSIYKQDYCGEIIVFIRDDGSTDNTLGVINNIRKNEIFNRKIILSVEKNVGPQKSFLKLIQDAPEADIYFFADQDDVWDVDKIRAAVGKIQHEDCACYCSNYRITNEHLEVVKDICIQEEPKFSPLKTFFYNQIPGCTMAFNYKLFKLFKEANLPDVMMHDSALLCLAASAGKIVYDNVAHISHRIHGENVVGEGHKKICLLSWIKDKFCLLISKESYDISLMANRYLKVIHENNIVSNYEQDLELVSKYKDSFRNTLKLLRHADSKDKVFERTTLSIRSKILFRLF